MRMGVEGLTLQADEADRFLKAAQNVARHYSVETTQRTLDWIAFAGVSVQVIGTRVVAVMVTNKRKQSVRPQQTPHAPSSEPVVNLDRTPYQPSVPPGPLEDV